MRISLTGKAVEGRGALGYVLQLAVPDHRPHCAGITHDSTIRLRPNILTWVSALLKLKQRGGSKDQLLRQWDAHPLDTS